MISIPQFTPKRGLSSFVRSLFANSEQGAWYDPSDMATLFQDAAGTTPVTAVEQPVSLMLDKSKGGVGTNGAKRVNLLSYTEQFDNAYWGKLRATVSANTNATTDPLGTNTADKLEETATTGAHNTGRAAVAGAGTYTFSIYVKAAERTKAQVSLSNDDTGSVDGIFDLSAGTVGSPVVNGTGWSNTSVAIQSAGNDWYKCSITSTGSSSTTSCYIYTYTTSVSYAGTTGSGIYIWGADLRRASEANTVPTYQRITDTWYNTMSGNHAYTPSTATASRPVLSARVNLLTKTEQFNDAVWVKGGSVDIPTVTANTTVAPDGTTTADTITNGANATGELVYQDITVSSGATVTYSARFKKGNHDWIRLTVVDTTSTNGFGAWFDITNGTVGATQTAGTGSFTSKSITSLGNGWYNCIVTGSIPSTTAYRCINASANADNSFTRVNNGTRIIWGADFRVSNDGVGIPAYQRVNTSTDYGTVGFPMYLKFDGSDDYMLTNSVDFRDTDKVTCFVGIRKLSDAARGIVFETSSAFGTSSGTFLIDAPESATNNIRFASRGTTSVATTAIATGYTAPISTVVTGIGDISNNIQTIRINGSQQATTSTSQGTGNYANQPLYIGARNTNSVYFNGRIYSMIIRGASSSDAQIAGAESYVNSKTRAY